MVKCNKCEKDFKSDKILLAHLNKKISCDRKLKCPKCNKNFIHRGDLNRHLRRKTPCEPILGNTQEPLRNYRTCHFCYREFKNKYTLNRHFGTCKIKNGNMPILFQKIQEDKERILQLEKENKQIKKIENNYNGNVQNFNLQFNMGSFLEKTQELGLLNFGDLRTDKIVQEVIDDEEDNIRNIIQEKPKGTPKEWGDRIGNIVKLIYRNPQHPQLQNVFTTGSQEHLNNWKDPKPIKAFLWYRDKWSGAEWIKVREYLIRQINEFLPSHRRDKLKVKSNLRRACDSLEKEIKEPLREPKLINEFFGDYEDSRSDVEFVWIFIAQALDLGTS